MHVLIIADDLTGALDSAVMLARAGLRCRVACRPSDIKAALEARADVLAVSTASREGADEAAREAVDLVFDAVAGPPPAIVFKKIDSRLKGHIAAELTVVAERTGIARGLVMPAIPAQGRLTDGGHLIGAGVDEPIDIAGALAGSGLALDIPDTRADADLYRAVAVALGGPPTLLVGASGLAAAVARYLGPGELSAPLGHLPAPLLLAIGSRDPITLAQIDALREAGLVVEVPAPDGRASWSAPMPSRGALLVQLVSGGARFDVRIAGARFARTVAKFMQTTQAGTLFCCGGETADAILGELGVGVLAVEGELLPGVPVSTMVVNERTVRLVTKSGGFGPPGTLISVAEAALRVGQEHGR